MITHRPLPLTNGEEANQQQLVTQLIIDHPTYTPVSRNEAPVQTPQSNSSTSTATQETSKVSQDNCKLQDKALGKSASDEISSSSGRATAGFSDLAVRPSSLGINGGQESGYKTSSVNISLTPSQSESLGLIKCEFTASVSTYVRSKSMDSHDEVKPQTCADKSKVIPAGLTDGKPSDESIADKLLKELRLMKDDANGAPMVSPQQDKITSQQYGSSPFTFFVEKPSLASQPNTPMKQAAASTPNEIPDNETPFSSMKISTPTDGPSKLFTLPGSTGVYMNSGLGAGGSTMGDAIGSPTVVNRSLISPSPINNFTSPQVGLGTSS